MKEELNPGKSNRRDFIRTGVKVGIVTGVAGMGLLSACHKEEEEEDEGQEVSPPEDLMQEHGLLNRVLLIYDDCRMNLLSKKNFDKKALLGSAGIIRTFVEDYHEKQEENYLFPRFEKAKQLTDLVKTLREQHKAGRIITDNISQLAKVNTFLDTDTLKMIGLLDQFNRMYRPHESREDTVLFPAFRKIVSKHEYDALGEEFEKNEHRLFGESGFEGMVEKVAAIEKSLGIYELAQFTPDFK
ncbi:MAG TPA: hemerythrin domain-containing protein [Flavobacterium sp.]|nr:hemerythrin domain-containing protein [Flavobacterium sp.]